MTVKKLKVPDNLKRCLDGCSKPCKAMQAQNNISKIKFKIQLNEFNCNDNELSLKNCVSRLSHTNKKMITLKVCNQFK